MVALAASPVIFMAAVRSRRAGNSNSNSNTNGNRITSGKDIATNEGSPTSPQWSIVSALGTASVVILVFGTVVGGFNFLVTVLKEDTFLQRFVGTASPPTPTTDPATPATSSDCDAILSKYTPTDLIGLYGDMTGQFHRDVDTSSPLAAALFDQGMIHIYGFNQVEGIRNMRAAIAVDGDCAMCYWGVAQGSGPNINTEVKETMAAAGKAAIEAAYTIMARKDSAGLISEANAALIIAQRRRFSFATVAEWAANGQARYDQQYADAMLDVYQQHPDDDDAAAIYAEAVLNLSPWQYYTAQLGAAARAAAEAETAASPVDPATDPTGIVAELAPRVRLAYRALEAVLAHAPNRKHPLALHLTIHIAESGSAPSRGIAAADALAKLSRNGDTGTGHLLHMPAHIYLRTGRYADCIASSVVAIAADRAFDAKCVTPYVPTHNVAMLVSAALYSGRLQMALEYSPYTVMVPEAALYLSAIYASPKDIVLARFGQWEQIDYLHEQQQKEYVRQISLAGSGTGSGAGAVGDYLDADGIKPYVKAVHLYARTLSAVSVGSLAAATAAVDALKAAAEAVPYDDLDRDHPFYPYHREMADMMSAITQAAFLVRFRGDADAAATLLRTAVAEQDSWSYMEPENFYFPVRHCLGAVLVKQAEGSTADPERARRMLLDAVAVYEADLAQHPNTGWSLKGLELALQGLAGLGDATVASARAAGLGLATPEGAALDAYLVDTQRAFAASWTNADPDFRIIRGSCCEILLC